MGHKGKSSLRNSPKTITMTPDELKKIITAAIVEANRYENEELEKKEQRETKEEKRMMEQEFGWKDYEGQPWYVRCTRCPFNRLQFLFRALCTSKDKTHKFRTRVIISVMLSMALWIVAAGFLILSGLFFIGVFWLNGLLDKILSLVLCLIMIPFVLLFFFASKDVMRVHDDNYLIGLFASIAAVISIILSVIAIVQKGGA